MLTYNNLHLLNEVKDNNNLALDSLQTFFF